VGWKAINNPGPQEPGLLMSTTKNKCVHGENMFNALHLTVATVKSGLGLVVCLKIDIHKIHKLYKIQLPKYQNPPTKYEIHCPEIEIHKVHEIQSKATSAKYQNT